MVFEKKIQATDAFIIQPSEQIPVEFDRMVFNDMKGITHHGQTPCVGFFKRFLDLLQGGMGMEKHWFASFSLSARNAGPIQTKSPETVLPILPLPDISFGRPDPTPQDLVNTAKVTPLGRVGHRASG